MRKLYRQIKLSEREQDDFVFPHKMAMTGEKLHRKSEIAYELGLRDKRIAGLEGELKKYKCLEGDLIYIAKKELLQRDLEQRAKGIENLKFPSMLRKMWASWEVQEWLTDQAKALKGEQ